MTDQSAQEKGCRRLGIAVLVGAIAGMMNALPGQATPLEGVKLQTIPIREQTPSSIPPNKNAPADQADVAVLLSLAERYGCIIGHPYKQRADYPNRYEFAAGLNACEQQLNQLTADGTAVKQEDLDTLHRLEGSYTAELTAFKQRVAELEQNTRKLEQKQFSPTTKLHGETVLELSGVR